MKPLLIALTLVFSASVALADAKRDESKPPVTAQKKPEVKKPCKDGQDPKKDNCHELKKIEKKK
jgi:hypothetical protein